MHKFIITVSAIIALSACKEERKGNFELRGTLTEGSGEVIYLEKLMSPQPLLVDSATLDENGNFEFRNYLPNIGFYRIKTSPQNFAMLVLDSSDKVSITGSIKDLGNTYTVKGSPESELFVEYNNIIKGNKFQTDSLNLAFQTAMGSLKMDSLKMDSLSKIFQPPYEAIMNKFYRQMADKIKSNANMYASIMAIQGLEPDLFPELYLMLDAGLSKKYPNDKNVRAFHGAVSKMLSTLAGQEAPDFKLPTPEGNELALSSLRGKIVLIDFWASWCGPCRKEMPNVVKIYKKYKNKGFEILGVSLDQDKNRWTDAIKSDGMTWPQVSDLKHWESETAKQYGVQGIPYTVLIDKEGKIIAKGLRGPDLEKAIEDALKGNNSTAKNL
jgi:peroxiredoxin